MKTEDLGVHDWTELKKSNLRVVLCPSMLDPRGKISNVSASKLKEEVMKDPVLQKEKKVCFDRRFVLHSSIYQLKNLNYLQVSSLLREILAHACSEEQLKALYEKQEKLLDPYPSKDADNQETPSILDCLATRLE